MPDQFQDLSSAPMPSGWRNRLASNRKLVILTGGLLVLVILTVAVALRSRSTETNQTNQTNTATATDGPGLQSGRTFERFQAVVNRPSTGTATNTNRPSKEDTAKAIQQLTNSNQ